MFALKYLIVWITKIKFFLSFFSLFSLLLWRRCACDIILVWSFRIKCWKWTGCRANGIWSWLSDATNHTCQRSYDINESVPHSVKSRALIQHGLFFVENQLWTSGIKPFFSFFVFDIFNSNCFVNTPGRFNLTGSFTVYRTVDRIFKWWKILPMHVKVLRWVLLTLCTI